MVIQQFQQGKQLLHHKQTLPARSRRRIITVLIIERSVCCCSKQMHRLVQFSFSLEHSMLACPHILKLQHQGYPTKPACSYAQNTDTLNYTHICSVHISDFNVFQDFALK